MNIYYQIDFSNIKTELYTGPRGFIPRMKDWFNI